MLKASEPIQLSNGMWESTITKDGQVMPVSVLRYTTKKRLLEVIKETGAKVQ
jgi:hypothetical protein